MASLQKKSRDDAVNSVTLSAIKHPTKEFDPTCLEHAFAFSNVTFHWLKHVALLRMIALEAVVNTAVKNDGNIDSTLLKCAKRGHLLGETQDGNEAERNQTSSSFFKKDLPER